MGFYHCPKEGVAYAVGYLQQSDLLVAGCDSWIVGWRLESGSQEFRLEMKAPVRHILTLDGEGVLIVGGPKYLTVVDPGGQTNTVEIAHESEIKSLSKTKSGDLIQIEDWKENIRYWRFAAPLSLIPADPPAKGIATEMPPSLLPRGGCGDAGQPAFRTDSHTIDRPDLGLLAFAMEDNGVLARWNDRCYILRGNTHNLSDLKILETSPRFLLASAGQIGRARHGVVVWDLSQPHPLARRLASRDANTLGGTVAVSGDGSLVAAHWRGVLQIFDLVVDRKTERIDERDVRQIVFSPTNSELGFRSYDGKVWTVPYERGAFAEPSRTLEGLFLDIAYTQTGDLCCSRE